MIVPKEKDSGKKLTGKPDLTAALARPDGPVTSSTPGFGPHMHGNREGCTYKLGQVQVFGEEGNRGIGKNYDGFRVLWTKQEGFNVVENWTTLGGFSVNPDREIAVFSQGGKRTEVCYLKIDADGLRESRIAAFKRDVQASAPFSHAIAGFVATYGKEMGIEI